MTPPIARKVVNYFSSNVKTNNELDKLTPREYEVVEGIKDGLSYKMIADRCNISIETVRYHVKNIYRKLHINSKSEVVNLYYKNRS
jgi:DNA-binding NarL/FixJ family response regulator